MRPWGRRMSPPSNSIIPTYNSARDIAESIGSDLVQTRRPIEIFVIDDGSADHTRADVSAYLDPRIRYVEAQHRRRAAVRNAGIGLDRAEHLALLVEGDAFVGFMRLSE